MTLVRLAPLTPVFRTGVADRRGFIAVSQPFLAQDDTYVVIEDKVQRLWPAAATHERSP